MIPFATVGQGAFWAECHCSGPCTYLVVYCGETLQQRWWPATRGGQ